MCEHSNYCVARVDGLSVSITKNPIVHGVMQEWSNSRELPPMATFQVAPPEKFDFTPPEQWPGSSRRFERFETASGLAEKEDVMQVSTLMYSMGSQADVLACFTLTVEQRTKCICRRQGRARWLLRKATKRDL